MIEKGFTEFLQPRNSIIYFLVQDEQVVYVGKSMCGISRPLKHKDKEYNRIFYRFVQPAEIDFWEYYYILKFTPKYNVKLCSNVYPSKTFTEKISRLFGTPFHVEDLHKIMRKLGVERIGGYCFPKDSYFGITPDGAFKIFNYLFTQRRKLWQKEECLLKR